MDMFSTRERNQAAYKQLKPTIDATYPPGRFVAIEEGKVIADAATFDELDAKLLEMGRPSPEIFVVQAGVTYPDKIIILLGAAE
jgi:hypothetical protein